MAPVRGRQVLPFHIPSRLHPLAVLVPPAQRQHFAVREGRDRRIPATQRHRTGQRPTAGPGIEDGGLRKAVRVRDMAAGSEQPAVRKERVTGAEELVGIGDLGVRPGVRVPEVPLAGQAPQQQLPGRQQMDL